MTIATAISAEERTTGQVLLRNISWDTYSAILNEVGDSTAHLTYDRGLLEIEVPSLRHERIKRFVGQVAEIALGAAGVDFEPAGSTTCRREEDLRGLEADECYYIQNAAAIRGKDKLDLAIDPPPDLAIEVDLTSSSVDKIAVYGSLGVPEIWRLRPDGGFEILARRQDGTYQSLARSQCLPQITLQFLADAVRLQEQLGYPEAIRRLTAELKS